MSRPKISHETARTRTVIGIGIALVLVAIRMAWVAIQSSEQIVREDEGQGKGGADIAKTCTGEGKEMVCKTISNINHEPLPGLWPGWDVFSWLSYLINPWVIIGVAVAVYVVRKASRKWRSN